MRRSALRTLLAAVEHTRQALLETLGLQKALLDVFGDNTIELLHRNGAALATGLTLPGFGAARVIPVPAALSGPQHHRPSASSAKADAGKEGRAADDARRGQRGVARLEQRLHRFKFGGLDNRRRDHLD